ncbi:MAG: DUF2339 domain-containing protein [Alphaproteobacteria bacterium]
MDEFFLILLGVVAVVVVMPIVALVKSARLGRELEALKRHTARLAEKLETLSASGGPMPAKAAPSPSVATPPEPQETQEPPAPTELPAPKPEPEPGAQPPAGAPVAPQPSVGLEESLGTKWVVWLGGVALALGGIFLVRYSIEEGLLGPGARIALAGLLGLALVGAGEYARRADLKASIVGLAPVYIPGILVAAGVLTGFATVYAAYALYGFLSPALAFVALAGVAVAGLAISTVHGPSVAALGLIGSYATPLLASTGTSGAWGLFPYLIFVTGAVCFVARARRWLWLALAGMGAAIGWGFLWNVTRWVPADGLASAFYLGALVALALYFLRLGPTITGQVPPFFQGQDWPAAGTLAAISILALALVRLDAYSTFSLVVFAAVAVVFLASAWVWASLSILAPWAALLFGFAYLNWHTAAITVFSTPGPLDAQLGLLPFVPPTLASFVGAGAGFAALFGLAGLAGTLRKNAEPHWVSIAVLTPLVVLAYAYWRVTALDPSLRFGAVAVVLAAAFAFATEHLSRAHTGKDRFDWGSGIYAAAAAVALALAMTMVLEKGWLTVALALLSPALAWIALQRPVPILRVVGALAAIIVTARLVWNPLVVGVDPGATPIFNWLLYGYGVPALAFGLAAKLFRQKNDGRVVQIMETATIAFAVVLVSMQIRHLMNGGTVYAGTLDLRELSIHTLAWLGVSLGLHRLYASTGRATAVVGSAILGVAALASILVGHLLALNPLFTSESMGENRLFSTLVLAYLAPSILAAGLFATARGNRHKYFVLAAGLTALLLAFAYVTLETRLLFQGPVLALGFVSDGETYAYSAVWLVFGLGLLAGGIFLGAAPLRHASFAVVMLTVAKVFLLDMGDLTGLLRALSFIGLGATLVGIGFIYQKLVFPASRKAPGDTDYEAG